MDGYWSCESHKTKTIKTPCVRCRCLLRAIDAAACLKILKQAWPFSASHIITLAGHCIYRKAINIDKPLVLLDFFLPRIRRIMRICLWEKNRSKSLLLSPGLRLCSQVVMFIHTSKLACLNIPICLVCPLADRKPSKQNSCPWQYKKAPLEPQ